MTDRFHACSHAPPEGSRSGVADYAATLLRALEQFDPPKVDLYHLGNNRLHEEIYAQALRKPGVAVLHDAVLHHFLLGTLSRAEYIEEFVYNYGEWRRHLAEELWAERASSAVDPRYFRFPLLRRVVERSRAVIVHNPGAASLARTHGARAIHTIPHFFEQDAEPDAVEVLAFRSRIGVAPGVVPGVALFGIFGYLRETKRVSACLKAFGRLHAQRPGTALLLAGEASSPDLVRLLETEAVHPAVFRMGHFEDRALRVAMAAIDCCLNLRYPAAGETSGIAIRAMGAGKPVVLTDNEENADIPVAACLRVSAGVAESGELFDHMSLVAGFTRIAREIGAEARCHIREHHSLERAVRLYREVLCAAAS